MLIDHIRLDAGIRARRGTGLVGIAGSGVIMKAPFPSATHVSMMGHFSLPMFL